MSIHNDHLDCLTEAIAKARAMAHLTWGEQGVAFREMRGDIQGTYLWALADLIEEASKHLACLQDELTRAKGCTTCTGAGGAPVHDVHHCQGTS